MSLTRAEALAQYPNLSGAKLSGADLSKAKLSRANLTGTCLDPSNPIPDARAALLAATEGAA